MLWQVDSLDVLVDFPSSIQGNASREKVVTKISAKQIPTTTLEKVLGREAESPVEE